MMQEWKDKTDEHTNPYNPAIDRRSHIEEAVIICGVGSVVLALFGFFFVLALHKFIEISWGDTFYWAFVGLGLGLLAPWGFWFFAFGVRLLWAHFGIHTGLIKLAAYNTLNPTQPTNEPYLFIEEPSGFWGNSAGSYSTPTSYTQTPLTPKDDNTVDGTVRYLPKPDGYEPLAVPSVFTQKKPITDYEAWLSEARTVGKTSANYWIGRTLTNGTKVTRKLWETFVERAENEGYITRNGKRKASNIT